MRTLLITAHGHPAPKGSLRHVGGGRLVEQVTRARPWREAVTWQARLEAPRNNWTTPTGPLDLTATIVLPDLKRRRPHPTTRSSGDLDKHLRTIFDALTDAQVIRDDSQIVTVTAAKIYANGAQPGATIIITNLDETAA